MFSNLFKIKKEVTSTINDFYLGHHHLITITIKQNRNKILFDKTIAELIQKPINILWFSNLHVMEDYFAYFVDTSIPDTSFIIIY